MEPGQVGIGRGNQRHQLLEQLDAGHDEAAAAIGEAALHVVGEAAVFEFGEPRQRDGTARAVSAQAPQAASGTATDIVLAFDDCVLRGQKKDGAIQLTRDLDNDVATFEVGVVDDETRAMHGAGLLDIGHDDAFTIALTDGFAVVDHGGVDTGLSCGAELRMSDAGFDIDDDTATLTLALTHDTRDEHFAMATTNPVVFDGGCGCPRPGASIVMDVPRPLGRDGETGRAEITWRASDDDNACAKAVVTLSQWPTSCAVGGDCGKAATATALSTLLTAFCYVQ